VNVLVIGQGAVGRALTVGLQARQFWVKGVGSRDLTEWAEQWKEPQSFCADVEEYAVEEHEGRRIDAVIYAAGPAGEAACRRDPRGALHAHYIAPWEWSDWVVARQRRMVLISTVVTEGFYGSAKQMALDYTRDQLLSTGKGAVLALQCGQIIGPEMPVDGTGVIATWVRQAVRGEALRVDDSTSYLTVTLCADLIDRIATWLTAPITSPWEEERVCLPDSIPLPALARVCRTTARIVGAPDPAPDPVDRGGRVPFEVFSAIHGMAENAHRAQVSA
jgi:nucleoside-diphosphate-sugar epimerase